MKIKKQIDPNIKESELVIIARTEEEFSQVVKQYHLQDLTANEEDKLYLATNQGFEIINSIYKINKKLSRILYGRWKDKSKVSFILL